VKLLNGESGIVLRGENAILDASDSFITGRSVGGSAGLAFTWVCPIEMTAICAGKNGS
jgi:hypothetical protein